MKSIFILKNIILGLVVTVIWGLPACKPDDPTSLVVRVVKVVNNEEEDVQGATVWVYCTEPDSSSFIPPDCIVQDIQTTGATGLAVHTFEFEAVLAIEVTKIEGANDTLSGTGIADLVENETIQVKVKID